MVTCKGERTTTCYVGTMRHPFTDNDGVTSTYDVPGCIYDSSLLANIIGVPFHVNSSGDASTNPGFDIQDDGTSVLSSICQFFFKWDHVKHNRHFTHPNSSLSDLTSSQRNSYVSSFCMSTSLIYRGNINFAFSSAFFLYVTGPHRCLRR